ncbi:acyl-CoA synthetase domain protein [Mycobacterium avium subsp. avium 2285 (R)]|nr:acyl-CoA synthetase domain protein [Mycobacterium avium subsp. avium 2285 (R)]
MKVKIFDDNGKELPQGEVGRIFVGNTFPFAGYTGAATSRSSTACCPPVTWATSTSTACST